jgi:hypothetical protein
VISRYQSLPELEAEWQGLEVSYPGLARLHTIGKSTLGKNIIVLQVRKIF